MGVVDGSISYLFSSVPLRILLTPQSEKVPLPELLRSYRPLTPLPPPTAGQPPLLRSLQPGAVLGGDLAGRNPQASLLYGRLYLPQSQLEALVVKRLSQSLQVQFSAVSGQHLRNGGTTLGLAQYDVGKYALEGLASSDGGLLGLRGVYNFGGDAEQPSAATAALAGAVLDGSINEPLPVTTTKTTHGEKERIYGRFSTGAEIYYGTLNKSGGISLATRFATLPSHNGTPLSATLTLNPLMGSIGASYAVVAGKHCSLATRMEFNVFSYESAWAVGMELWRKPFERPATDVAPAAETPTPEIKERSFKAKMEWRLDVPKGIVPADDKIAAQGSMTTDPAGASADTKVSSADEKEAQQPGNKQAEEYAGVLKARLDQNLRIGILWEGRVKSLLFSLGSGIDLRHMDKPFRTLGLEVQFSS